MAHLPALTALPFARRAVALAGFAACAPAVHAQSEAPALPPVVVTSSPAAMQASPSLTGFGSTPLADVPMQTTVVTRDMLEESQARRLADVFSYEAAATDAYNSPGYWGYTMLRGYVLDQRYNYRREGLPITAETVVSLANKERVEFLKGTSGIQAGTSAPGGLVNFLVKRPTDAPVRTGTLTVGDRGSVGGGVDVGGRAGVDGAFGYRVNLAYENTRPDIARYGHAEESLAAVAADWRLSPRALLEAELEASHQVGRSVPGHSLLGDRLPTTRHPVNLNDQPWTQPNKFGGLTGTLRFTQELDAGWQWTSTVGLQRLRTDDRLAYPSGYQCYDPAGAGLCDRYGPNGNFDVYDFRSEDERRRVDVAQTAVQGTVRTGRVSHTLNAGLQYTRRTVDGHDQAYNYVGEDNIDVPVALPADPTPTYAGTNSSERNLEVFATDAVDWGGGLTTWLGLRATRLNRETVDTQGNDPSTYANDFVTPWLAASYEWARHRHVYASWGQGTESYVAPDRPAYANQGQAVTAKSRQWEVGTKGQSGRTDWGVAYFDIDRPRARDTGDAFYLDGSARHRGVDGTVAHSVGPWRWRVGAMWLRARIEGSDDPAANGRTPVNVPEQTLKAQVNYRVPQLSGLDLQARVVHEGRRSVTDDNAIELPSWTRTDLTARYMHRVDHTQLTWTLGVFNAFDRQAWKESPMQYGHVYLFPLEARTVRLSVMAEL